MDTVLWILVALLVTLVGSAIAIAAIVIALRKKGRRSAELAREQEQLNRRSGATPAPAPAAPGSTPAAAEKISWWKKNWRKLLKAVLTAVGGAIVVTVIWRFFSGVPASTTAPSSIADMLAAPSLKRTQEFIETYWLWILLAAGVAYVTLFFFSKETKDPAQKIQKAIVFLVVALFIGVPLWNWISSPKKPTSASVATAPMTRLPFCPNATSIRALSCSVPESGSDWFKIGDASLDNGKRLCFNGDVILERRDEGITLWQFKARSGNATVKYRLIPRDDDCSSVDLS
jgi:hypothetical protein